MTAPRIQDAGAFLPGIYALQPGETGVSNVSYPVGDLRRYGAVAGAADNTVAIQHWQDSVYAVWGAKGWSYLPPGTWRNGRVMLKTNVYGDGQFKVIDNADPTKHFLFVPQNSNDPNVGLPGFPGFTRISGITIDGNLAPVGGGGGDSYTGSKGIYLFGNDINLEDLVVQNCFTGGILTYRTPRPIIRNCRVTTVRGSFGDGIYTSGADDALIIGNVVQDVTRIGIVSEAADGQHSNRPTITANNIYNAHDQSGGQINAGIWCENTNSATVSGNFTRSTNTFGIVMASYATDRSEFLFEGNHISDCVDGYSLDAGTAAFPVSAEVRGGSVTNISGAGITVLSMNGTATVDGVHFGARAFAAGGHGHIVTDFTNAPAGAVCSLVVMNCTKETDTYVIDAASINLWNPNLLLANLTIADCVGDWSVVSRQGLSGEVRVSNTTILTNTATYSTLAAPTIRVRGCPLGAVPGSGTIRFALYAAGASAWLAKFDDCDITGVDIITFNQSASSVLRFRNCDFTQSYVEPAGGLVDFDNCSSSEHPATGLCYGNFYNTAWELRSRGGYYRSSQAYPVFQLQATGARLAPARATFVGDDVTTCPLLGAGITATNVIGFDQTNTAQIGGPASVSGQLRLGLGAAAQIDNSAATIGPIAAGATGTTELPAYADIFISEIETTGETAHVVISASNAYLEWQSVTSFALGAGAPNKISLSYAGGILSVNNGFATALLLRVSSRGRS